MVKEILFATSNQGKARELKEAFKQADVDVIIKTNADLEIHHIQLKVVILLKPTLKLRHMNWLILVKCQQLRTTLV